MQSECSSRSSSDALKPFHYTRRDGAGRGLRRDETPPRLDRSGMRAAPAADAGAGFRRRVKWGMETLFPLAVTAADMPAIPGLRYLPDYVSAAQERALAGAMDGR